MTIYTLKKTYSHNKSYVHTQLYQRSYLHVVGFNPNYKATHNKSFEAFISKFWEVHKLDDVVYKFCWYQMVHVEKSPHF